MKKQAAARSRMVFRMLAALVAAAALAPIYFDPAVYLEDWFYALCLITTVPLFIHFALTGKTPRYFKKLVDDEHHALSEDISPLFTKISAESIGCAVVFISLVLFVISRS